MAETGIVPSVESPVFDKVDPDTLNCEDEFVDNEVALVMKVDEMSKLDSVTTDALDSGDEVGDSSEIVQAAVDADVLTETDKFYRNEYYFHLDFIYV